MVDRLRAIALKTQWLKPFTNTLVLASFFLFIYVIFGETSIAADDLYLIPSLLILIWSLLCCSFLYTFPYVPIKSTKADGLIKQIKTQIIRGYYYLLMLIAVLASLAVLLVSIRIISIWVRSYN